MPVPEVSCTMPDVSVTAPVRLMLPDPLALRAMLPPPPVEALALMAMPELLPFVAKLTVAVPEIAMAPLTVSVPPELTVTLLVVPLIAPRVVVLEAPSVLTVSVFAPRVIVWPDDVNAPPLFNCKLYTPAGPAPDTSTVPPTVKPPEVDVVPIISVPAVMVARSVDNTLKIPEPDATDIVMTVFGNRETVPVPALTLPEKPISRAVMVMVPPEAEEMVVEALLPTVPKPLALRVVVAPPPILLLTLISPSTRVVTEIEPVEVTVTGPETIVVPELVKETEVLPPVTVPVLMVPPAFTVKVFVPRVIV